MRLWFMVTPQGTRNSMEQLYASSILLFKSQFVFEHVDNFSLQNGRLGDKGVIKKRHCRTVVPPFWEISFLC